MSERPAAALGRAIGLAIAADVLAVLVFVGLGRRSHDRGSLDGGTAVADFLGTAAPFLVALVAAYVVVLVARLPLRSVLTGVVVWAITAGGGLVLRRTAWDRSTAASFVVVATIAIGVLIVGWRGLLTFARGTSEVTSPTPPPGAGR